MTTQSLDELLTGDIQTWIAVLPEYQREHIESLLQSSTPVEVAEAWLSNMRPQDTAPYGGFRIAAARFYDNILRELQKLFCGALEYEEQRKEVIKAAGAGRLVLVGAISTAIAPHVGAAAAVLGPTVALTLGIIAAAGKVSVCETLSELIEDRSGSSPS